MDGARRRAAARRAALWPRRLRLAASRPSGRQSRESARRGAAGVLRPRTGMDRSGRRRGRGGRPGGRQRRRTRVGQPGAGRCLAATRTPGHARDALDQPRHRSGRAVPAPLAQGAALRPSHRREDHPALERRPDPSAGLARGAARARLRRGDVPARRRHHRRARHDVRRRLFLASAGPVARSFRFASRQPAASSA